MDINPLSIISFTNIFSHSVDCLFNWPWVPLLYKSFKFDYVAFVSFCFYFFCLRRQIQKLLLQFMSKSVLPMFSSGSFMGSDIIFRFLVHFEFIFVYGARNCPNFNFMYEAVQFSWHHLLKRLSFLHCVFLPLLL